MIVMHHLMGHGKKGYSSNNGIVSSISKDNGKMLEFVVFTIEAEKRVNVGNIKKMRQIIGR